MRHGLLLPRATGLYAIPAEVAAVVGRARRIAAASARAHVVTRTATVDLTPSRARLGFDPSAAVVALMAAFRADGVALRSEAGAPRSAVRRAARAAGFDPAAAEMLTALGRAEGLVASQAPIAHAGAKLFAQWQRGGAWDEAREPSDGFRATERLARVPTPTPPLREALVDVLETLPASRFANADEVVRATLADLRATSAARLLDRARSRAPEAFPRDLTEIVRAMLQASLPALGALDRGRGDAGEVVRLSSRARRWLAGEPEPAADPSGEWVGSGRLRVGRGIPVAALVVASDAANPFAADGDVFLEMDADTVGRAFERGLGPDEVAERIAAVAEGELDAGAKRALAAARRARLMCALERADGVLAVDDPTLRAALLADEEGAELLSELPQDGLLVRQGASMARLARLVRRLGGELTRP